MINLGPPVSNMENNHLANHESDLIERTSYMSQEIPTHEGSKEQQINYD